MVLMPFLFVVIGDGVAANESFSDTDSEDVHVGREFKEVFWKV